MVPLIDLDSIHTLLTVVAFAMAIEAPYSMGIFETIVNVHFGGLAVEFFGPGDYEELINGIPDPTRLTLSVWFRIPKATLQTAYDSWVGDNTPFDGVTPIIIGGDDTIAGYQIGTSSSVSDTYVIEDWVTVFDPDHPEAENFYVQLNSEGDPISGTGSVSVDAVTIGADIPKAPFWIGIDSNRRNIESWDPEDGPRPKPNLLTINIQMADIGNGAGAFNYRTSNTATNRIAYAGGILTPPTPHGDSRGSGSTAIYGPDVFGNSTSYIVGESPFVTETGYADASEDLFRALTENFFIQIQKEITGDQWHHLHLVLDLFGAIDAVGYQLSSPLTDPNDEPDHGSITSSCNAYVVLDDVEYKGAAMRDPTFYDDAITSRLNLSPNGLYTPNSIGVAMNRVIANGTTGILAAPGAGFTFEQITTGVTKPSYHYAPAGIPLGGFPLGAPATTTYQNKVLDIELAELQIFPGVADRRKRLFISKAGKPVPPKTAAMAIGQSPAVLLHGSDNWIKGKNTGEGEGFEIHGRIERYRPDPSLRGPQSPADLKK